MSGTSEPLTASRADGTAAAVLIAAFFAAIWGLTGAFALPGAYAPAAALLVAFATAVFGLAVLRLLRLSRRLPARPAGAGANPFKTRAYRLAVLFEAVAIPVSAVVLNVAGYPGAVVSAVAAIVGLHFFGLIPAFRSRRFAAVGGAMVAVGLLSLLLPSGGGAAGVDPRGAAVGLGCALVLWVGVLPLAASARRDGADGPKRTR